MAEKCGNIRVMINWAPVPTLWAAIVAKGLIFEHDEALSHRSRWSD